MPKLTIIQTSFNAGELSPDLAGHVDIDRYQNGAKKVLNAVPQVQGGAKRRPGSRIIAPAKSGTLTTRLIPFVFNKSQAYVLEVGDGYARFYTPAGQIVSGMTPVELQMPYAASEVFDLEFAQRADTMFIAHAQDPIQRLKRISNSQWAIGPAPFDPAPIEEIGKRSATGVLTLGLPSGTSVGAFSSASIFQPSDVGRQIIAGPGVADIVGFVNSGAVTVDITATFDSVVYQPNQWLVNSSPQIALTPSVSGPVNGAISLTADGPPLAVSSVSLTGTTMSMVFVGNHGLVVGDPIVLSGFESAGLDGLYTVATTPALNGITFAFNGSLLAGGTLGTVYKYGAGLAWLAQDVGSLVSINGGLVEITGWDGVGIRVFGNIVKVLDATITAPANSWALKQTAWNPIDGYPRAVSLYQQRLFAAGSTNFPETIGARGTGLYFDFTPGTDDGDAFAYAAASDQVNQIEHLASSRILTVLTQGEEFSISGGSSGAVTPTNIDIKSQSIFGSARARPVRIANELIYAQRAEKKIRCMFYDFNSDSFRSQNLTRLAAHITGNGIIDMAFQAEPNPVVWMVRADGFLVSMTYDRDDNVCGFALHQTDGIYRSVAVIPGEDEDVVFVLVTRFLNGVPVQYVEIFDQDVMTDAAILGTNGAGATVWTGLGALEGKKCDVKGDGVYLGQFTVTGGQITIPRPAFSIEVGLHYESELVTLSPNLSGGATTSQGNQVRSGDAIVRMLDSINCVVDNQRIAFRQFGNDVLDKAPEPFTGDKHIPRMGWDEKSEISLKQDQPYQWHVLAFIRHFTVNNG